MSKKNVHDNDVQIVLVYSNLDIQDLNEFN